MKVWYSNLKNNRNLNVEGRTFFHSIYEQEVEEFDEEVERDREIEGLEESEWVVEKEDWIVGVFGLEDQVVWWSEGYVYGELVRTVG